MLKQTVQFTDFDGANKTKNIYFNLTRTEVVEQIDIKDEFEYIRDLIGGEERQLEMSEIKLILDLVKKLMKLSYGVQEKAGEDLIFKKDEANWRIFTSTAVYDEFLIGLFQDPAKAVAFLFGIWPKEFTDGIDVDQLQLPGMPVKMDGQPLEVPVAPAPEQEMVKRLEDYTREALLAMPQAEFDALAGTDPSKMDQYTLQIAFLRKSSGE